MVIYKLLYQGSFLKKKGVDFMGRDLKGKEPGVGVCQRKDGLYTVRFVSKELVRNYKERFEHNIKKCLENCVADCVAKI